MIEGEDVEWEGLLLLGHRLYRYMVFPEAHG